MIFGMYGLDSSVIKIYKLLDDLESHPEEKEKIHKQLRSLIRRYSSTLYTDFGNYLNAVKSGIKDAEITNELKSKFSSAINNLIAEYNKTDTEIRILVNRYNAESGKTIESYFKKLEIKDELERYSIKFMTSQKLNSAYLKPDELKIFLSVYENLNKKTQVSQIPKLVLKIPDFDINNDECIDDIINMYARAHKQFANFDAGTIEWEMSFQHTLMNNGKIDFSQAVETCNYLVNAGKKIRALGMVYPNASPNFDADITKEEFLTVFEEYLHQLFRNCPDVEYLDFFNELAYDEGMHGEKRENTTSKGVTLETGIDPKFTNSKGEKVSVFEHLFGDRYYIDLLLCARKVMAEEEKAQNRKINTKLMYNDFGHENGNKCRNILNILKDIRDYEKEYNIHLLDGVGIQCRLTSDILTVDENKKPNELFSDKRSLENIETFIELARNIDTTIPLEIQITELDVIKVNKEQVNDLSPEENQERVYKEIFDISSRQMFKGNLSGVTLGDFNDATSYSAYQERALNESTDPSPTMFEEDGRIKPFAENLIDNFKNDMNYYNEQQHYAGLTIPLEVDKDTDKK